MVGESKFTAHGWDFSLSTYKLRNSSSLIFIQARNQVLFGLTNKLLTATACHNTPTECKTDWRSLYGNNLPML